MRKACQACVTRRIRCSDEKPCTNCIVKGQECIESLSKRQTTQAPTNRQKNVKINRSISWRKATRRSDPLPQDITTQLLPELADFQPSVLAESEFNLDLISAPRCSPISNNKSPPSSVGVTISGSVAENPGEALAQSIYSGLPTPSTEITMPYHRTPASFAVGEGIRALEVVKTILDQQPGSASFDEAFTLGRISVKLGLLQECIEMQTTPERPGW